MNARIVVILIAIGIFGFCAGVAAWLLGPSDPSPGSQTTAPAVQIIPVPDHRKRRNEFLGGDPDRDVRAGQEMKPRW